MQQRLLALIFGTALVVSLGVALVSSPQRARGEAHAAARMEPATAATTVAPPTADAADCCGGAMADCPKEKAATPAPAEGPVAVRPELSPAEPVVVE